MTEALPPSVLSDVDRYLDVADRLLPGCIVGFHVVGSVALGAYRRGRSDIDFIALLDRRLDPQELRRLRAVHVATALRTGAAELLRRRRPSVPGVCNGAFVFAGDVTKPVTEIEPVASHSGHDFHIGAAFDVNPVVWKTLAERAITVRGPAAATLGLDPQSDRLVPFNRANLDGYWTHTADSLLRGGQRMRTIFTPRWLTAWCALGPPRLHRTIATGEVISKETAGEYALDTFGPEWHPLLLEALAYWREQPPPDDRFADPRVRAERTANFVLAVVEDARRLPTQPV